MFLSVMDLLDDSTDIKKTPRSARSMKLLPTKVRLSANHTATGS